VSEGLVTRIGHIDMRPQIHTKPVVCLALRPFWSGNFDEHICQPVHAMSVFVKHMALGIVYSAS
jgi:hypothetical protein